VLGLRTLLALFLPLLVVIAGLSFDLITIVILLAAPVIGWELPGVAIRARGRSRLDAIDRELPRLIDVLIATIEAGLGFAASLQMLAHSFKGPLGAELRLAQREQELGISTERALENLQNRCDTPSMRAFARSLIHAQELGVSIGPMLRNLAVDIRRRRRQTAREKIQKLPIKMLFPLMLILPPVFIVILYPAIYNIITSLHGGS
jgi:tight adherence protein C